MLEQSWKQLSWEKTRSKNYENHHATFYTLNVISDKILMPPALPTWVPYSLAVTHVQRLSHYAAVKYFIQI